MHPGSHPVRILLLNDNSEHPNWGAKATVAGLESMLVEALDDLTLVRVAHSRLRRQYRALALPPLRGREYWRGEFGWAAEKLLNRVSRPIERYPEVVDDFDRYAEEWVSGRSGPDADWFVREARASDAVVYNGENSIYRNTLEGCRALFLLWVAKTHLGKPSAALNQTAYLDSVRPVLPAMVRRVYPALDVVTCREPNSWEHLRRIGIDRAELVPDAVFHLSPGEAGERRGQSWLERNGLESQSYFCLSASALPASRPTDRWDGSVVELVRRVARAGLRPVLVARDPECMYLQEVARRTAGLFFGPDHTYEELWPVFRHAMFAITGHYHYVVICSMVGCPFVPLSVNNWKMSGLCRHLGWKRTEPFDITALTSEMDAIAAEAAELTRHRETLSASLAERASELHAQAKRNGTLVRGMIRRPAHVGGARGSECA